MNRATGALLATSALLVMTACGMPATIATPTPATQDVTGNWQFQTYNLTSTAPTPTSGFLVVGALKSQGNQISGVMRLTEIITSTPCIPFTTPLAFSGAIDAAKNLTLTSASIPGSTVTIQLPLAATLSGLTTGTLGITGNTCNHATSAVLGIQIPSSTGTFTGTVTQGTAVQPPPANTPTATAQLTVAQSDTPQSDGQFPATGSLTFTTPTCTSTTALTGTISGTVLGLKSSPNPLGPGFVSVSLGVSPVANVMLPSAFFFITGPCAINPSAFVVYQGTLTRN